MKVKVSVREPGSQVFKQVGTGVFINNPVAGPERIGTKRRWDDELGRFAIPSRKRYIKRTGNRPSLTGGPRRLLGPFFLLGTMTSGSGCASLLRRLKNFRPRAGEV
jgi:hypothetical protein